MEVLKIFLAARSSGVQAELFLETKNGTLTTKYRSVEHLAGEPAKTSTFTVSKKRKNPAQARRSKLRQEKFFQKKMENQMVGKQSGASQADQTHPTALLT